MLFNNIILPPPGLLSSLLKILKGIFLLTNLDSQTLSSDIELSVLASLQMHTSTLMTECADCSKML